MRCAVGSVGFLVLVITSSSYSHTAVESIHVTEVQAAFLVCDMDVDDGNNITVIWAHNNQTLNTSSPGIRVQGAMLLFLQTRKGDSGMYTCRESLQSPVMSQMCLSVGREPCPQPSDIRSVQQGTNHTLYCALDEISEIASVNHVSWKKDCKTVDSVRLVNIVPSDAGNYTCIINFTYEGKSYLASHTTLLKVTNDLPLMKPSVTYPLDNTLYVIPDRPTNLTCIASLGYDKEIVSETSSYWIFNHSFIHEDQGLTRHQHNTQENGMFYSVNVLSIQEFQQDFFSFPFQCVFLNPAGRDYRDLWLKPLSYRTFHSSLCSLTALILITAALFCLSQYHRYSTPAAITEETPILYQANMSAEA